MQMTEEEFVALVRQVDTDLKFERIARNEAKRTILCRPEDVDRLRWHIDQAGLEDVLTLAESAFVAAGWMYVADLQALEADFHESMSRPLRLS